MIELADLKAQYAALRSDIDAAVSRVLASGRYVSGPEVERFERAFAEWCRVSHAVAVGSGTDALRLALVAAGVGPQGPSAGDGAPEVVTSPFSFAATCEAIGQAGARPVFADVDPETLNLDPGRVEQALTPRTKAILPVHLYGHPADMEPLLSIARRHGIAVIEDACQAHGALYRGRPVGSFGEAGCFSFYPTKNLGACGDGGMLTTSRGEIAGRARRLRDHGQSGKYVHVEEGTTARLDEIQAAVLGVKLGRLGAWNDRRRSLAGRYRRGLEGAPVSLPVERPWARHVYHLFTVRVHARDRVREGLRERGVPSGVHYPVPLHLQPANAALGYGPGRFPEAERAAREVLSLPLFPEMTDDQVDRVCEALREVIGGR
ncbi:MAG: DegT/DnrJ/EryC1/StrS family aminotransferase [Gemmatimonadota bacterium]